MMGVEAEFPLVALMLPLELVLKICRPLVTKI
jgi:hypothetical protein